MWRDEPAVVGRIFNMCTAEGDVGAMRELVDMAFWIGLRWIAGMVEWSLEVDMRD